jgi:hypothetical protein
MTDLFRAAAPAPPRVRYHPRMDVTLRFTHLAAIFVFLGAAAGCGGTSNATSTSTSTGTGGGGGGAGGTAGEGGTGTAGEGGTGTGGAGTGATGGGGSGTGACDGYVGQATIAEIGLSPFADEEAEMLAIEASGKLVAPEHVYQRILSDLAMIRAQSPEVQGIQAMQSWALDEMLMGFDQVGLAGVQDGTYTDWDCANAHYGFTGKQVQSFYVLVQFGHRFNVPLLASEYKLFPHVEYAEPNGLFGDGNDVCVSIENETKYNYVFDAGSGDCPAGCIQHMYWGFSTDGTPVKVTPLGSFANDQGVPPGWFGALGACTQWL